MVLGENANFFRLRYDVLPKTIHEERFSCRRPTLRLLQTTNRNTLSPYEQDAIRAFTAKRICASLREAIPMENRRSARCANTYLKAYTRPTLKEKALMFVQAYSGEGAKACYR